MTLITSTITTSSTFTISIPCITSPPFLVAMTIFLASILSSTFWCRSFLFPSKKGLGGSTVKEDVATLGKIYWANVGYKPYHRKTTHGLGPQPSLARHFKGMLILDPGIKLQKALPICVYCKIIDQANLLPNKLAQPATAISQLLVLAYFWCMHSCGYSEVTSECQTKFLWLQNICFFNMDRRSMIGRQRNVPGSCHTFISIM